MKKPFEILYLERAKGEHSGIGRVFRQVAAKLDAYVFKSSIYQLPFGVNLLGIIKNLFYFKPAKADIFHITGDIHYMALVLPSDITVLTIHDLVLLRLRKGIRRYILKKLFYDLPVKKLKYITTISEKVKAEIIEETNCAPDKITVIENPLRTEFIKNEFKEFNESKPRLLQIGTAPNKNLLNTIKALEGLNCTLRIVGRINSDLQKILADSKIKYDNVWDLNEREIIEEYFNADIILFCSTYEGFGLPIIEGQAMKKCVITSNLSPMREVAGQGACLLNPCEPLEIRRAIEKIVADKNYRQKLISEGEKNVLRFDGKNIAHQYEEYYLKIIEAKN